jgi:hypothetical protein
LIWPRIESRVRRGTSGISSWSTDGNLFADGCAGRETKREGSDLEPADFALEEGAEAPGGAERDVAGFCEAAVGGAARCNEVREPGTCKPTHAATITMESTAIAGRNKRFGAERGC